MLSRINYLLFFLMPLMVFNSFGIGDEFSVQVVTVLMLLVGSLFFMHKLLNASVCIPIFCYPVLSLLPIAFAKLFLSQDSHAQQLVLNLIALGWYSFV